MVGGVGSAAEKEELWKNVAVLRWNAKASGTWKNLKVGWSAWEKYCAFMGIKVWLPSAIPGSESDKLNYVHGECFVCFVIHNMGVKCAATAIQYVRAVVSAHKYRGLQDPWHMEQCWLQDSLKGAMRLHPSGCSIKNVMTLPIMRALNQTSVFKSTERFGRLLRMTLALGVMGMRRSQDLLVPSARRADPYTMLCKGDVVTSVIDGRRRAILFIKRGKTDQTGEGTMVPFEELAEDDKDICPVTMIFDWLDRDISHLNARDPFLADDRDKPLTYKTFSKFLKLGVEELGFDPKSYAPHCMRSGGATAAFAAGVDMELIKQRGNWRSSAVLRYTRPSVEPLLSVGPAIAGAVFTPIPRRRGAEQEATFPDSKRRRVHGSS